MTSLPLVRDPARANLPEPVVKVCGDVLDPVSLRRAVELHQPATRTATRAAPRRQGTRRARLLPRSRPRADRRRRATGLSPPGDRRGLIAQGSLASVATGGAAAQTAGIWAACIMIGPLWIAARSGGYALLRAAAESATLCDRFPARVPLPHRHRERLRGVAPFAVSDGRVNTGSAG